MLPKALRIFTLSNMLLPTLVAALISSHAPLNHQQLLLTQCMSLVLLGMFLATLATLNFSLAFLIGLLASPLSFTGPALSTFPSANDHKPTLHRTRKYVKSMLLQLLSPPVVTWVVCTWSGVDTGELLAEAAFGWKVSGLWTQVVVWCVWWPAWLVGTVLVNPIL
jgi:glycosylphosphatidylinositol transamidase